MSLAGTRSSGEIFQSKSTLLAAKHSVLACINAEEQYKSLFEADHRLRKTRILTRTQEWKSFRKPSNPMQSSILDTGKSNEFCLVIQQFSREICFDACMSPLLQALGSVARQRIASCSSCLAWQRRIDLVRAQGICVGDSASACS